MRWRGLGMSSRGELLGLRGLKRLLKRAVLHGIVRHDSVYTMMGPTALCDPDSLDARE
jgi:hypothetical protein